eukprot:scaffold600727_cov83-Attheya_sp.AAC.1
MPPVEPRWLFFFFVIIFVVGEGGVVLHFEAFECVLGNFVAFSLAQDKTCLMAPMLFLTTEGSFIDN